MTEPHLQGRDAAPPAGADAAPAERVVPHPKAILSPPEPPENPPVRIWRRLAALVVALVVVLILVGFVWTKLEGDRIKKERAELEAHLDRTDPDWRLADLERAREDVPEDENSARVVVAVAGLVKAPWPPQAFTDRFTELQPVEQLNADQTALLDAEMKPLAPAVAHARRLADMPRGRHRLVWQHNPIATLLPDQQETRKVATLMNYDALLLAQKGDVNGSLRSCRAILNAGRSLGDEPLMISALIRCAIIAVGANAAERTLAQGVAGDKELAALQHLLDLEERHPTMRIATRGERASSYDLISKMADGRISGAEMAAALHGDGQSGWWQRLGRGRVGRREPVHSLRLMTKMVEATKLPEGERREAELEYEREAKSLGRDATYAKLLAPAVGTVGQAIRRKTVAVRCLLVLVAAERYRLKHGRWPAGLDELKPDLLKEIPADPFDGKPIRYKKLSDGVLVYSVGDDGADNGGTVKRNRPIEKGTDQGYRLWDDGARRQAPRAETLPPPEAEEVP